MLLQGVDADFSPKKLLHSSYWREITDKRSHLEVFFKKAIRKNFVKLTGRRLCRNLSEFPRKETALTPYITWQHLLQINSIQIWQFLTIFLGKYSSVWPNFFIKRLLYLVLWNEQRNFFFWLWLPWKPRKCCFCGFHGNGCEGEKFLCLFQKANTDKHYVRVSGQSRALDTSNRFLTTNGLKFYDSRMFRCLW